MSIPKTQNPYESPKSLVADPVLPVQIDKAKWKIIVAAIFMPYIILECIQVITLFANAHISSSVSPLTRILFTLLFFRGVYKGANWARIVWIILCSISLALTPFAFKLLNINHIIFESLSAILALYLMLISKTFRSYFKLINSNIV